MHVAHFRNIAIWQPLFGGGWPGGAKQVCHTFNDGLHHRNHGIAVAGIADGRFDHVP